MEHLCASLFGSVSGLFNFHGCRHHIDRPKNAEVARGYTFGESKRAHFRGFDSKRSGFKKESFPFRTSFALCNTLEPSRTTKTGRVTLLRTCASSPQNLDATRTSGGGWLSESNDQHRTIHRTGGSVAPGSSTLRRPCISGSHKSALPSQTRDPSAHRNMDERCAV